MGAILTKIIIVGAGSSLGGMARYLVSRAMQSLCHAAFPWGTLLVNILGCFIIGLVYGLIDKDFQMSEGMKLFITVGFCGGFTTFSTFMHENFTLFNSSKYVALALYTASSIVTGFAAIYFAYRLVRQ